MSSVVISGDTSGSVSLTVPAVAGSNTVTLPAGTGTIAVQGVSTNIVQGTSVASTSGTSITFSSIPSWVKRITVMFYGVSSSGTSNWQIQIGSGSYTTTGYSSGASNGSALANSTSAFLLASNITAAQTYSGHIILTPVSGNNWVQSGTLGSTGANYTNVSGGSVPVSGIVDRLQITTVNGTDTFDAGSINILYE
jgi:hypothetical protein